MAGASPADVSLELADSEDVVNQWRLGRVLGTGAFSEVREGKSAEDGRVVAVKVLSRSFLKKKRQFEKEGRRMKVRTALDDVQREIAIMKKVQHANLVSLVEVIDNEETDNLFIVLEFVDGGQVMSWRGQDRRYESDAGGVFDEPRAKTLCQQVLAGLAYLHAQGIVHRDLKPENLLLTRAGVCKIADFGIAQKLEVDGDGRAESLRKMQGTHQFMAPEMLSEDEYDGFKLDMWALGVCLHAFVLGSLPFWGDDTDELFEAIELQPLALPDSLSESLRAALEALLSKEPAARPDATAAAALPWLEMAPLPSAERIQLTQEDELAAITPVKLDMFKVTRLKGRVGQWRKKAAASSAARMEGDAAASPAEVARAVESAARTPALPAKTPATANAGAGAAAAPAAAAAAPATSGGDKPACCALM